MRSFAILSLLLACVACNKEQASGNPPDAARRNLQFVPGGVRLMFGGGFGSGVHGLLAGDFLGNGRDELVFFHGVGAALGADAGVPNTSLELLATGASTRSSSLDCGETASAAQLISGHFDGGPTLDLVMNGCARSSKVVLGNGDGTFTPGPALSAGYGMLAADFNGDGLDDLLTGEFSPAILLAAGDGTFQPVPQALPTQRAFKVRVARLDGDSHPDLIVWEGGNDGPLVLLGAGNGTFRAAPQLPAGFFPSVIGDFDGDGLADLVSTDAFVHGRGDGTFVKPQPIGVADMMVRAAADFDLDGRLDLAGQPQGRSRDESVAFLIALGQGNGRFDTPVSFEAHSTAGGRYDDGFDLFGVMDLDGDRKPDVFGVTRIFEFAEITTRVNITP